MLSKLKRKFHAAKYLCSIHFIALEPWPQDDKPISIFWQRGSKKSKRGQTTPTHAEDVGEEQKSTSVRVNQNVQVSATLYATSSKHKQTGPYQKKEVKLWIMQMTEEGEMFALLGNATINLADIAGPHETLLEIPVSCDYDIVRAVGKPKLTVACRAVSSKNNNNNNNNTLSPPNRELRPTQSGVQGNNDLGMPGTHSDFSSMSSDPAAHQHKKKLGVLTTEQATSLEGFDGRAGQLDSIMEVLSPRPDSELNDSANSINADDAKEVVLLEKPPQDDMESSASMSPHTPPRLNTITEEATEAAGTEKATKVEPVTNTADAPKQVEETKEQAHFADILEDRWTGYGGKKVAHAQQENAMGKAITEWWMGVMSLVTCIPQPPKED